MLPFSFLFSVLRKISILDLKKEKTKNQSIPRANIKGVHGPDGNPAPDLPGGSGKMKRHFEPLFDTILIILYSSTSISYLYNYDWHFSLRIICCIRRHLSITISNDYASRERAAVLNFIKDKVGRLVILQFYTVRNFSFKILNYTPLESLQSYFQLACN